MKSISKAKSVRTESVNDTKTFPVTVVVEHDVDDPCEYKWTAYCPALPACFSEGRTREEAIAHIREVIATCFDLLAEDLADKDLEVVEVTA